LKKIRKKSKYFAPGLDKSKRMGYGMSMIKCDNAGGREMVVIAEYGAFNQRRYSNPWVAIVDKHTGKMDFPQRVGGYTGGWGKGEAGQLYIIEPVEGAVYAYGQKDHRGNNGGYEYAKYIGGQFVPVAKVDLIKALQG
jgi:hypothetical protein